MIPYFRKIRIQFAEDNKPLKYLRYAIGEIVLVVIGILIAVNINNWNEKRKDSASELTALIDLKQEFSKNFKVFNEHNLFKKDISQNWLNFISNISNQKLAESERLITPIRPGSRTYNPSRSVLNSILSTGKIDKVENDSLKYFLTSWNDLLLDYAEDEARHLDFWDKEMVVLERSLLPYRYYNVDTLDPLKNPFYTENETKKMFLDAYDNLEYQNLLLRNLYFLQENVKNGELLLKVYNSIIQLLEDEIRMKNK
jgi:hypothetical protein